MAFDTFDTSRTRLARPRISTGANIRRVAMDANDLPNRVGQAWQQTRDLFQQAQPASQAGAPVGTSANPSPSVVNPPRTGLTPVRPNQGGSITRGGQTTNYAATPARDASMNSGGTMTTSTGLTRTVAPSPRAQPGMTSGGTMTRAGQTVQVAPSPRNNALATPANNVVSPTTSAAPQTESNNPMTGDGNQQPSGTTAPVNPAADLGFSQRGSMIPRGFDKLGGSPSSNGLFQGSFKRPQAGPYSSTIRNLFGEMA